MAQRLNELNMGTASSKTLTEAFAVDHPTLLDAVLPDAGSFQTYLDTKWRHSRGLLEWFRKDAHDSRRK